MNLQKCHACLRSWTVLIDNHAVHAEHLQLHTFSADRLCYLCCQSTACSCIVPWLSSALQGKISCCFWQVCACQASARTPWYVLSLLSMDADQESALPQLSALLGVPYSDLDPWLSSVSLSSPQLPQQWHQSHLQTQQLISLAAFAAADAGKVSDCWLKVSWHSLPACCRTSDTHAMSPHCSQLRSRLWYSVICICRVIYLSCHCCKAPSLLSTGILQPAMSAQWGI